MKLSFARTFCVLAIAAAAPCALAQGIHVTLRANANPFPAYQSYAGVWGDGNYAYIGSERRNGVLIYDVSNPDAPVLVGTYAPTNPNSFDMEDIKVANGIGYFADNFGSGLHIVDVSNPANPTLIAQITSADGGYDKTHKVAVWQNFVFIPQNLAAPALIKVFDVSNPASPVLFTTITATDAKWVNDLTIQTTTAGQVRMYTAGWNSKGDIWDITNLATTGAVLLGSFTGGVNGSSVSATDDGNYLAYSRKTTDGTSEVKIWNITNPAAAAVVSTLTMSALGVDAIAPHDPKIMGNLLYVSWFQAGTLIFDISNPAAPVLVGSYDTYPGVVSPAQLDGNWGVYPYLGQDRVLLSDRNTGLYVVDATGVSSQPALYNLHLNPVSVAAGSSSTGTVYLVGLAGVGGTVVMTSSDNSAATTPPSVTVPQNATSAHFTVSTSPVNSTTTANISATYGGATNTAKLTISPVPDFTMALGPSQLTLFPSQSGTFNGTLTSVAGYGSTVTLSCTGSAPPVCAFTPSVVTPTAGGAPFTLDVSSDTVTDYSFTVQGVGSDSKTTTHQIATTVSVVDFTLGTPSPNSLSQFPGASSQFTVQVGAAGSFSGTVDLSCNTPATGVSCSFSPSASVMPTLGNPVNVTVTVASAATSPAGQYSLAVTAASSNAPATKNQSLALALMDFGLTSSAASQTVAAGQTASFPLAVSPIGGGFPNSVAFSCSGLPTLAGCTFSPSSVTPGANTGNVTLSIATTAAIASAQPLRSQNLPLYAFLLPLFGSIIVTPVVNGTSKKKISSWVGIALLVISVGTLAACGGGASNSGGGPQPRPGTPSGTYHVMVTGVAGSLSHSTTVTLTVQ